MTHAIGIIGVGKIARDQHIPALRANPAFDLIAVASPRSVEVDGVRQAFTDHRDLLRLPELEAVAICTPPQVRHAIARDALSAGKHVLLEKPPAATLSELEDLRRIAKRTGRVVFTAWHSQHAAGVEPARRALEGERVRRLVVTWREDVRQWHPGQIWIWQPGGFGVFDPGVNALSIVTRIVPELVFVHRATLEVPSNRDAPIAAELTLATGKPEEDLRAVFDWRETGRQTWRIEVETESGRRVVLSKGGACVEIDGRVVCDEAQVEYRNLYRRFATLLDEGRSDLDADPFRLVADAFMVGRRVTVEAFAD